MRMVTHTKATRLKLDLNLAEGKRDCEQMITEQVQSQRAASDQETASVKLIKEV